MQPIRKQFNPPGFQQPQHYAQRQSYPQQGGAAPPSSADFEELKLLCKSQVVSIKTLENQIGQIANTVLNRQPGTLPSDTEVPGRKEAKEQVKAITLRSGKVDDAEKAKDGEDEVVDEEEKQKEKAAEPRKTTIEHTLPEGNTGEKQLYPPPPVPKKLQQQKLDKQFGKFLEVFKKLHINIPFVTPPDPGSGIRVVTVFLSTISLHLINNK
ncbi:hypothetical protein AgCh_031725 [Apium graveolens]